MFKPIVYEMVLFKDINIDLNREYIIILLLLFRIKHIMLNVKELTYY